MVNETRLPIPVWRAVALAGIIALGLVGIVGSGGGSVEGCGIFIAAPCPYGSYDYSSPPLPIINPTETTVQVGGTAIFTAMTPGVVNATYQWSRARKGSPPVTVVGASGATFSLVGAQLPDDESTVTVFVTGTLNGTAYFETSVPSTLNVSSMPPVVFQDGEFLPADWSSAAVSSPAIGGPTHDESQAMAGGNPGTYRKVAITMPGGVSSLTVFDTYQRDAYDPATQGAVQRIDFTQECIALPGMIGSAPGLLLQQGGRRYGAANALVFCGTQWQPESFIRNTLSAPDFYLIDGPACAIGERCPDFTAGGATMRFGFVNSNAGTAGVAASSGGFGIDNWLVRVWRR